MFERNILNCKNGFYWSVLQAFYYFIEFIKIKDLQSRVLEGNEIVVNSILIRMSLPDFNNIVIINQIVLHIQISMCSLLSIKMEMQKNE